MCVCAWDGHADAVSAEARRSRPSCSCFLGITSFSFFGLGVSRVLWSCRVVVSRLLGVAAQEAAVGLVWALGLLACSCVRLLQAKQQCHAALLRVLQMHRHLVPRLVFGLRLACILLCYPAGSTPRSNRCDDPFPRFKDTLAEQRMLLQLLAPQIRAAKAKAKAKAKFYARPPRRE